MICIFFNSSTFFLDWLSFEITYGLYLSDHTIINDVETETVVLSGIMIQNLRSETHWHLRGIRRVGVSQEDVEKTHQCVSKLWPPVLVVMVYKGSVRY